METGTHTYTHSLTYSHTHSNGRDMHWMERVPQYSQYSQKQHYFHWMFDKSGIFIEKCSFACDDMPIWINVRYLLFFLLRVIKRRTDFEHIHTYHAIFSFLFFQMLSFLSLFVATIAKHPPFLFLFAVVKAFRKAGPVPSFTVVHLIPITHSFLSVHISPFLPLFLSGCCNMNENLFTNRLSLMKRYSSISSTNLKNNFRLQINLQNTYMKVGCAQHITAIWSCE